MIPYLHKKGATISYYDPTGEKTEFSKLENCKFYNQIADACINADLVILHTEWDEFKSLDFSEMKKNKKFILYDLRNLYDYEEMKKNKIKYFSIGRPVFN
jgi:UDPglucose 6-dehydrogenase